MDNPRPPRISRYDAKQAILALDVPVIEQYVYTNSNVADAAGMVRSLWFSALGRGDVALLDAMYEKSTQGTPAWGVPDAADLVQYALTGERPENVAWALDHLPPVPWAMDGVRRGVTRAIGIVGRQDAAPRPFFAKALGHVIARYPSLLADVAATSGLDGKLRRALNLIARQANPHDLPQFIDFLFPRKKNAASSDLDHGVCMWVNDVIESWSLPEFSRLAQAADETPPLAEILTRAAPPLDGRPANLWQLAIKDASPVLDELLDEPEDSDVGRAFSSNFTNRVAQDMVNKLASRHPARLARLLSRHKSLVHRLLALRTSSGENIVHLLAAARVSNPKYASPKELSWARLEGWVQRNALLLVNEPRHDGVTPLGLMGSFPTWSSRLRKQLLAQVATPFPTPSHALPGSRL